MSFPARDGLDGCAMTSPAHTEDEFRRLVEPHRRELHAHCYRMLGSVHDAEDALQEALLRAWRGLGRFEGRSSLRSWLYRIATNTCLDRDRAAAEARAAGRTTARRPSDARRAARRAVWLEPYPDDAGSRTARAPEARYEQRESVELAFIAALQHLPANQRAALILRDVLGFSAARGRGDARHDRRRRSTARCSARARASTSGCRPSSQQETLRDARRRRGSRRSSSATWTALERGDVDAMVALLAEDGDVVDAAAAASGTAGCAAITRVPATDRLDVAALAPPPARANGQLAVGCYMWDETAARYAAA